jgi:hypothetical protein
MRFNRARMLAILAALAVVPQPRAARAADVDVNGTFQSTSTGDGGGEFVIKFTQVGDTVTGSYSDGSGQIGGKLVGRRLDATWREGRDDGWLTFNFTADGKAFDGEWGYHGEKPAGKWLGKRT